jgi:flagellar biosynthesis protein FlhF
MNVRKFTANTSREALRLLREALGADAVILSNRNVDGKVEIMAMADEAIQSIAPRRMNARSPESTRMAPSFQRNTDIHTARHGRRVRWIFPASVTGELSDVMNEIRSMRNMLESQLAELSWANTQKREPQKALVLKEMLATG